MAARAGRFFGKFFGRTIGDAASFAIGGSISRTIDPVLQEVENEAWQAAVNAGVSRPVAAGTAAAIAAEDVESREWSAGQAAQDGYGPEQFDALYREALSAPGIGELFEAYRRDLIDDAAFTHGLRKAKLEPRWDAPLHALKRQLLDPAVIARAIQRGLIPDPGLLPVGPPETTGRVPAFPVFAIDALKEAAGAGIDRERLGVEVGLVGNPMSPEQAASALFRAIIERADFDRAIAEGNTRNEWRDAILEQARQIPSVTNYVEAHVRDWISEQEMLAGAAKHGMKPEDARLEFLIHGRPPSWHQIWIGLQRGGVYDGPLDGIDPAFLKGLRESDIRPEWYNLLWHSRYNYPAPFVLRALAQGGDLTQAETAEILQFLGWEPSLREKVSRRWTAAGAGGDKAATATDELALYEGERITREALLGRLDALGYTPDEAERKADVLDARRVVTAKTTAISGLHIKFKKGQITADVATAALRALTVAEWATQEIIHAWTVERDAG